ncbi:OmpA family protein [Alistipes timonensis]|uniref:OmpA family protein n=1 Tax=Alistipes timonensis TaxID=1465754 RepID=UPI0018989F8E|nr:OmpA family protein [Alistipes timonensis]
MKHFWLFALLLFSGLAVQAQEKENRDAQGRIVRGPYETNRFFDNIFVGVAGGVNLYFGENDSEGKFGKRLAPALDIHAGKWFTPSIGARVGYAGLQAKGWTTANSIYAKGADGNLFKEKFGVMYLHADAMWNLSNALSGYREDRTWNFVPYAGVGWARSYGNDTHDNEIGFDIGLLNVVRLCKSLDLTIEARCLLVNQRFDGVSGGRLGEGMLSVTAGLAYKFNRRGFKRASNVQPIDITPYLNRIRGLEENNSELASKNSVLNDENEKLRNAPAKVVVEQKVSASPVVLFFKIGKATLDSKELTNLEFYVKNAIKADKDKTFTLIGSADKATGSRELNQRLSEQRMEYVYNLLKNKYGVAPDRLVKKAEGDTNNRFAEPELNRAVIVE